MDPRIHEILDVATSEEAAELKVLYNAQIQTLKAYQNEPTAQRKRDWDAAQAGLEACLERLKAKYKEPAQDQKTALASRAEALRYLNDQGYKVKKTKLYHDCKTGKLQVQDSGEILVCDLEAYIQREGLEPLSEATGVDPEVVNLQKQKLKNEVERLDWEVKRRKFEYEKTQGDFIPKENFVLEMTARVAMANTRLKSGIRLNADEWIDIVDGDHDRRQEFLEAVFEHLNTIMNELARMDRFQVLYEDEDEKGPS